MGAVIYKMHSFHRKCFTVFFFLASCSWSAAVCNSCSFVACPSSSQHPSHRRYYVLHASESPRYKEELLIFPDGRVLRQVENRMLPHQRYSGVLNYEEYRHWLRFPHDYNASFSNITSNERHFTSIETRRGGQTEIHPPPIQPKHFQPIYVDDHIIVLNKPSGILSVPGPRRHECAASLAYRYFGKGHHDIGICNSSVEENIIMRHLSEEDGKQLDTMIVHRLDRDTSGVLLLARNDDALKQLHNDFKNKARVKKTYVALVCGHWTGQSSRSCVARDEGEIDLPLVRDIERPPFMRVATAETEEMQQKLLEQQQSHNLNAEETKRNSRFLRMVGKGAKSSLTTYRILSYEYLDDQNIDNDGNLSIRRLPVTRLELHPITGRTHQLRVHCAAMGHPIVGDSIYGFRGEGAPHGGLSSSSEEISSDAINLQQNIYNLWLKRHTKRSESVDAKEECMLCLHAQQLNVFHPYTNAPMSFSSRSPF